MTLCSSLPGTGPGHQVGAQYMSRGGRDIVSMQIYMGRQSLGAEGELSIGRKVGHREQGRGTDRPGGLDS